MLELLAEVALQEAFESLAMSGFIAGHLIKTCASLGFAQGLLDQVNSLKPLKFLHLSSVFDTSFEHLWYIYHSSFLHLSKVIYHFSYNNWGKYCARGHSLDYRSYIEYECDKAVEAGIKIVVLYNAGRVDKNKCPQALRNCGNHIPMWLWKDGQYHWDYQAIKNAIQ